MSTFTIGVDFGTLSARAVGVDVATGRVISGVTHTHSTYAVARGETVPCVLTAMADEFGGEIPIEADAIRQLHDRYQNEYGQR